MPADLCIASGAVSPLSAEKTRSATLAVSESDSIGGQLGQLTDSLPKGLPQRAHTACMGLPSAGSRASELPEISESHNFAAPLAATGCHKLAEQVLGAGLKFLWLIIDQIYRSGPEEETR